MLIKASVSIYAKILGGSSCVAHHPSDNVRLPCVFPFTYLNNTYHACTWNKRFHPWCATKVDEHGVLSGKSWGYCSSDCPSYENPRLILSNDTLPGKIIAST